MKKYIDIFLLSFILISVIDAQETPKVSKNGMVVSASQTASQVGVDIMKSGGNAIDAAVATGFALAVTYPQAGNIGGGGFLVAHFADGRNITIDFRETAPAAAHRDMYLNENGEVINDMSLKSHRAVAVPGSVAGLITAWRQYGSGNIPLKNLLEPAIILAKNGFPISAKFAQSLNSHQSLFKKDDGASAVFIRADGKLWKADDLLIQNDLSKTLQRIAKNELDGFYSGKTAELFIEEMQEGNGFITLADLNLYNPKFRVPLTGKYKNYDIISMGPPSSGGILLIQMLNMLENYALGSLGFNSADYIHLLTEIERRAYADRAEHLGDSDYWEVPIEMLISKKYATERTQNISMQKATPSTEVFAGDPIAYESPETTHYSVIDKDGSAVSVSTTLNTGFGSGILVEGAGFFLNNEMDDFSVKPGTPNIFGLIGNKANAISPNKRPLSSMTPTIVLKDNRPFFIIGSPGGSRIITTVLQVILNIIEHDMTITDAVSAPRTHSQWLPDVIMTEPEALSDSVQKELESRGHKIIARKYIGSANGILIKADGYYGGPDPRWENSAIGY
ncbi:MAG: gamma-glutamyltransferase [Calditrichia bacterium]